jgi:hypothetical protein
MCNKNETVHTLMLLAGVLGEPGRGQCALCGGLYSTGYVMWGLRMVNG